MRNRLSPSSSIVEKTWDKCIVILAIPLVYISVVLTAMLLIWIFGVPFVEGK